MVPSMFFYLRAVLLVPEILEVGARARVKVLWPGEVHPLAVSEHRVSRQTILVNLCLPVDSQADHPSIEFLSLGRDFLFVFQIKA